jgi:hypothetical protein
LHAHVALPGAFVHAAFASQPPLFVWHSSTSVHVLPSPVKPSLHVQVKPPSVFAQVASALQSLVPEAHSSTSVHVAPSPEKPALHTHCELPVPEQVAFGPHLHAVPASPNGG